MKVAVAVCTWPQFTKKSCTLVRKKCDCCWLQNCFEKVCQKRYNEVEPNPQSWKLIYLEIDNPNHSIMIKVENYSVEFDSNYKPSLENCESDRILWTTPKWNRCWNRRARQEQFESTKILSWLRKCMFFLTVSLTKQILLACPDELSSMKNQNTGQYEMKKKWNPYLLENL